MAGEEGGDIDEELLQRGASFLEGPQAYPAQNQCFQQLRLSFVVSGELEGDPRGFDAQFTDCGLLGEPIGGFGRRREQAEGEPAACVAELGPYFIHAPVGQKSAPVEDAQRGAHFAQLAEDVRADEDGRTGGGEALQSGAEIPAG